MPRRSVIDTLPGATYEWLAGELERRAHGGFKDLAEELREQGHRVGKSQVGRASQALRKEKDRRAERIAAALERLEQHLERIAAALEKMATTGKK